MERVNFFGFNDDKLYYDERKKRFVFLENAPKYAEQDFKGVHFSNQRPDLYGAHQESFTLKMKLG